MPIPYHPLSWSHAHHHWLTQQEIRLSSIVAIFSQLMSRPKLLLNKRFNKFSRKKCLKTLEENIILLNSKMINQVPSYSCWNVKEDKTECRLYGLFSSEVRQIISASGCGAFSKRRYFIIKQILNLLRLGNFLHMFLSFSEIVSTTFYFHWYKQCYLYVISSCVLSGFNTNRMILASST